MTSIVGTTCALPLPGLLRFLCLRAWLLSHPDSYSQQEVCFVLPLFIKINSVIVCKSVHLEKQVLGLSLVAADGGNQLTSTFAYFGEKGRRER